MTFLDSRQRLDGSSAKQLVFSPQNCVGEFIASLDYESEEHVEFVFSHDGSRLASLTEEGNVTWWNGENGNFIGAAKDVGDVKKLASSDDGSFLAAAEEARKVKLWSASVFGSYHHAPPWEISCRGYVYSVHGA